MPDQPDDSHNYLRSIQKKTYADLTDEQRTQQQWQPGLCEARTGHVVERPRIWPPRLRSQSKRGKDYASARCLQCGANVIIYDPLPEGVRWADEKPKAGVKAQMRAHVRDDLMRRLAALDASLNDGRVLDYHDRAMLELVALVRALVRDLSGD